MHGASEMQVLVARGRRTNLLLIRERSRRLLFHEDSREEVVSIRAKARPGLLPSQDR